MQIQRKSLAFCASVLLVPSWAAAVDTSAALYVIEASVSDVIIELAGSADLSVYNEGDLSGRVQSSLLSGSLDDILLQLSQTHSLRTFIFNGALYASHVDDMTTRILSHPDQRSEDVLQMFEKAGLPTSVFRIASVADERATVFTAPQSYFELAEAIVGTMTAQKPGRSVKVRRGVDVQTVASDKK